MRIAKLRQILPQLFALFFVSIIVLGCGVTFNTANELTWQISPVMVSLSRAHTDFCSNFTIIFLPDTQYYSQSYPEIFDNQTRWIVNNAEAMNIVFVTHVGDIVQNWDAESEWQNANHSVSILDNSDVPYGILPGNHDGVCFGGNTTNYNKYFGSDRFYGKSWYSGSYQNNNDSYQLFSAGGDDYLIFHFEYAPSDDALRWANATIDKYPDRRVIVTTHAFLTASGNRSQYVCCRPAWPPESGIANSGEQLWQKFIKPHADQIFLVLSGHFNGEARRNDSINGHTVFQLLANYQGRTNGGNGWLRILEFCPMLDRIYVKTYSPYLNSFERDSDSEFDLDYNMTGCARLDLNDDHIINILDIAIVARAYGAMPGDSNWNQVADLNDDDIINILDVAMIARHFGETV